MQANKELEALYRFPGIVKSGDKWFVADRLALPIPCCTFWENRKLYAYLTAEEATAPVLILKEQDVPPRPDSATLTRLAPAGKRLVLGDTPSQDCYPHISADPYEVRVVMGIFGQSPSRAERYAGYRWPVTVVDVAVKYYKWIGSSYWGDLVSYVKVVDQVPVEAHGTYPDNLNMPVAGKWLTGNVGGSQWAELTAAEYADAVDSFEAFKAEVSKEAYLLNVEGSHSAMGLVHVRNGTIVGAWGSSLVSVVDPNNEIKPHYHGKWILMTKQDFNDLVAAEYEKKPVVKYYKWVTVAGPVRPNVLGVKLVDGTPVEAYGYGKDPLATTREVAFWYSGSTNWEEVTPGEWGAALQAWEAEKAGPVVKCYRYTDSPAGWCVYLLRTEGGTPVEAYGTAPDPVAYAVSYGYPEGITSRYRFTEITKEVFKAEVERFKATTAEKPVGLPKPVEVPTKPAATAQVTLNCGVPTLTCSCGRKSTGRCAYSPAGAHIPIQCPVCGRCWELGTGLTVHEVYRRPKNCVTGFKV